MANDPSSSNSSPDAALSEFDWLSIRNDFNGPQYGETTKEKLIRKFEENPLVPVGSLLTLGALTFGLWSFRQGRTQMSQYMMRLRVLAQGFTVTALIIGIGLSASRKP